MPRKKTKEITREDDVISWTVPEYSNNKKNKRWYLMAGIVGILLLIYSLFTANFLFAVIVVTAAMIIIMRQGEKVSLLEVTITDDGVEVGKDSYNWDGFNNFSIVYRPKEDIKNLYFEFKSFLRPRLSIPLEKMNPLLIRKSLLKYLEEDLERTDLPLSEQIEKMFGL